MGHDFNKHGEYIYQYTHNRDSRGVTVGKLAAGVSWEEVAKRAEQLIGTKTERRAIVKKMIKGGNI